MQMVNQGHLGGYIAGGDPSTWCPQLWSWAVQSEAARSVLDVGCGEGHSTGYFRALGCEVLGLDGFDQAIRDSVIPDAVRLHDFNLGAFFVDFSPQKHAGSKYVDMTILTADGHVRR